MSSDPTGEEALMQELYQELSDVAEHCSPLAGPEKSVVLFRIAVESGAKDIGLLSVVALLSKLLATTIGIMEEHDTGRETSSTFEGILDDLQVKRRSPN